MQGGTEDLRSTWPLSNPPTWCIGTPSTWRRRCCRNLWCRSLGLKIIVVQTMMTVTSFSYWPGVIIIIIHHSPSASATDDDNEDVMVVVWWGCDGDDEGDDDGGGGGGDDDNDDGDDDGAKPAGQISWSEWQRRIVSPIHFSSMHTAPMVAQLYAPPVGSTAQGNCFSPSFIIFPAKIIWVE